MIPQRGKRATAQRIIAVTSNVARSQAVNCVIFDDEAIIDSCLVRIGAVSCICSDTLLLNGQ